MPLSSARLFYDISERARRIIESYFLLNSTLHFSYTHLVCRTAITGQAHTHYRQRAGFQAGSDLRCGGGGFAGWFRPTMQGGGGFAGWLSGLRCRGEGVAGWLSGLRCLHRPAGPQKRPESPHPRRQLSAGPRGQRVLEGAPGLHLQRLQVFLISSSGLNHSFRSFLYYFLRMQKLDKLFGLA